VSVAAPEGFYVTADMLSKALYLALGWSTARYRPDRPHREGDYATYDPIPDGIVSGDPDHEDWTILTADVMRALWALRVEKRA
jgi:hypothetical protein